MMGLDGNVACATTGADAPIAATAKAPASAKSFDVLFIVSLSSS
jgi:hypothetical protein